MTSSYDEEVVRAYEAAAEQLDSAAAHCRTAAHHYRDGEVPRGAAHAWSACGHIREASELSDTQARQHARRSNPI